MINVAARDIVDALRDKRFRRILWRLTREFMRTPSWWFWRWAIKENRVRIDAIIREEMKRPNLKMFIQNFPELF